MFRKKILNLFSSRFVSDVVRLAWFRLILALLVAELRKWISLVDNWIEGNEFVAY